MDEAWAVTEVRRKLVESYSVIAAIMCVHWLLAATLGGANFLDIRSANDALGLSGLTFAFAMGVESMVPMPGRLFKIACPVLGLPDSMPTLPPGVFNFDGQTSCEAFANGAAPMVLLGLPLILLATSAIVRIVLSRRR